MPKVLDSVTMPIKKNGTKTDETFINNPKSTAPQFSASTAYTVGQYVFYNKKLYRFTAAHAAGAWNASHVTEVTVGSEIASLKEDITNLSGGINSAYVTESVSGSVASFDDGADGVPVRDLVIGIEPVQAGSSDPAPDNVRPISGWTGAKVYRTGANLIDTNTITYSSGKYVNYLGGLSNTSNYKATGFIPIPENTKLFITGVGADSNTIRTAFYSSNSESTFISAVQQANNSFTVTTPEDAKYMRVSIRNDATGTFCVYVNEASTVTVSTVKAVNVDWTTEAGTVYGGTLDVVSGVLTVTHANIASYDGETLPGEWISDRDVYASGTTPTTGAQVVYELATPVTYQLTPITDITTLRGLNNIWADTGDVSVTYNADPELYIADETAPKVVTVSGSTPTITAEAETRYICGTVTSISFTPSASGICDVVFTSGSTPAVLTIPNTVKLPEWFDATSLEANTTYEINIMDGVYGTVMTWT